MSRQVHLTSGPITGQLIRLCLPLLAANVLQQLYNIINSLVVTYYIGGDAFAALGVAESVMNLFIYVITGACMGSSVLVARFFGEENFPRLRQQLFVSGVLIGGAVLAAVVLTLIFLHPLLLLIQTPPELMGHVTDYLRIILVGMVFTTITKAAAAAARLPSETPNRRRLARALARLAVPESAGGTVCSVSKSAANSCCLVMTDPPLQKVPIAAVPGPAAAGWTRCPGEAPRSPRSPPG